jgi:hypothetical protein
MQSPRGLAEWALMFVLAFLLMTSAACGSAQRMNEVAAAQSQLEDVSRAALRIQTAVSIGAYKPVAESLNELAYQIALAKRVISSKSGRKAMAHYDAALSTYLAVNEVWTVGYKFRSCEADPIEASPNRPLANVAASCFSIHKRDIEQAAAHASISVDDVENKPPDELLGRASREIDEAERARPAAAHTQ